MITFNEPLYLFLILFVPIIVYFNHFFKNRGGTIKFPISNYGEEKSFKLNNYSLIFLYFLTYFIFYLSVVVMILTLAGLSITRKKMTYLNDGADIVIVLDISPSMGAIDFHLKNRLDFSKELIKSFVSQRENDNISLIAFGKEASVIVPLTSNKEFFYKKLEDLYVMDLGNGSALGLGISIALSHLKHSESLKKSIMILTDGVINSDEVYKDQVINLAHGLGVKLYSIGIGSNEEVNVDFKVRSGKNYQGSFKEVYDSSILSEISNKTGGFFYSVNDDFSFQLAIQDFSKKESIDRKVKISRENYDVYKEFLYFALLLIVLYFILSKLILKEVL